MQIAAVPGLSKVDWYVDGKLAARTTDAHYPWPLERGTHSVKALVWTENERRRARHRRHPVLCPLSSKRFVVFSWFKEALIYY